MAEAKTCPKCNGIMTQGRIMKYNEYAARNQYMYVFAPDDDSGPDLSKMFSGKPLSKGRKALVAYCCEQCGFTEFYGQASS
jgi:predicted nucleic-acid-binding Zn-ribbon protein